MEKLSLGIIFGGLSSEYEVSLVSASSVIANIDRDRYDVILIGISKKGDWYLYEGPVEKIKNGTWLNDESIYPAVISTSKNNKGLLVLVEDNKYQLKNIDVIFPVLHGRNGEDGSMQGLLTLAQIPFVGCGCASSAICMDKQFTHMVLDASGIKTAPWSSLSKYEFETRNFDEIELELKNKLSYPMFVKPANAGSSVGVSKAKNKDDLIIAIDLAFQNDHKIVIESEIKGKEIECSVIGNDNPSASVLGEVVPANEFYDYDAKYNSNDSMLYIPARIPNSLADEVRAIAIKAYKALNCAGLTRVDFLVTDAGEIFLNEPNTIPGFTSISMYPKLLEASGMELKTLIENLIQLAYENFRIKSSYNEMGN